MTMDTIKLLSARLLKGLLDFIVLMLLTTALSSFQGTLITQFVFNIQGLKKCSAIATDSGRIPQFDEDGDLVLPRSQKHLHCDPSESNVIVHIGINCFSLSLPPSLPVYHNFVYSHIAL